MNLRQNLLFATDDILDELQDLVDKYKEDRAVKVKYYSYTPQQAYKPYTPPQPYRPSVNTSSPIGGMDQYTYDRLSKLAETAISQPQNKKDSTMSLFNIPGLNGNAFGKLTGNKVAVDFQGQVVFRKPDGSYVKVVTDDEGNRTQVQVLDLKLDVDFYKVPTQTLAVGDLIELDGQLLYVEENNKGGVKFVNPLTGAKSSKLQQTNIFGIHFYSKIVSMFDLAGGQQAGVGLNGINPLMLMALQGKGGTGSGDISELLILSSLAGAQQPGANNPLGGINPMMLMMLGDNAGSDTMKQFMMLQMFAGQNGNNPFAPVSAAVQQAPVVASAAPRVAKVASTPKATTAKVAAKKSATPKKVAKASPSK